MKNKENTVFVTINHLDEFQGTEFFRVGDVLALRKDEENPYDDEAVAVYDKHDTKSGYVANSVSTVARGTCSAGRIVDRIKDETKCNVRFICAEAGLLIGEVEL